MVENKAHRQEEGTPWRFTSLLSDSSVIEGESKRYTTSHTTFSQTQPPAQLSSGRGYPISLPELNNVTPNSSKRPRGRPLGSKNKPKPPIVIKEDDDTILKSVLIEIPRGNDVVKTLINLAQQCNTHITVLSGSGPISEITLCHPVSRLPTLPIKGNLKMTSFLGTYMNANCGCVPPQLITNLACSCFSIFIFGSQGRALGGAVGGKVISAGHLILTVNLFKKPKFHKLSIINGSFEEVEEDEYATNGIINADHTSIEPTTNNGNNNTSVVVSDFSIAVTNSMLVNHEVPPPSLADGNVMQWNHSTPTDSY